MQANKPASNERVFIPLALTMALEDILCFKESRIVQHDNTVRYKGLVLQTPKNEFIHQYIKAEVKVHEYHGHRLTIFYAPLFIGRYDKNGDLPVVKKTNEIEDRRGKQVELTSAKISEHYRPNYFGDNKNHVAIYPHAQ